MFSIRYTTLANQDLFDIFEIIAEDKPNSAVSYIEKLEVFISYLESNPYLGVECKKKKIDKDCIVLIFEKNYLIFYKIVDSEIHILRILNARVDYQESDV